METITKRTLSGEKVTFELIKERFSRSVMWIWVKRNGVFYLRVEQTKNPGICKIRKFCRGYGWLSMGELFADFQKLTILDLCNF